MANYLKIAELDEQGVEKVKKLEKTFGTHIMAFVPGLKIANLSDHQLKEIKAVEDELGVILLAYADH